MTLLWLYQTIMTIFVVMEAKKYRCKYCKERKPIEEIQVRMPYVCKSCIPLYFAENKAKILEKAASDVQKKERQRLNKKREELMTLSDWLRIAQTHFNAFIRERDKGLCCIACQKPIKGVAHAGHYFSVGAFPELRFDEENVHLSCNQCNTYFAGNLIEYGENLPKKIGLERFEALKARRNIPRQYTIPEVKELIELYKKKLRDLKNSR